MTCMQNSNPARYPYVEVSLRLTLSLFFIVSCSSVDSGPSKLQVHRPEPHENQQSEQHPTQILKSLKYIFLVYEVIYIQNASQFQSN